MMVRASNPNPNQNQNRGLIVGNYTHDVLYKNDTVIAEMLGGASSFISSVIDPFIVSHVSSKVGTDFLYSSSCHVETHPPLVSRSSPTTVFHAYFQDTCRELGCERVLKRVQACDLILPEDLPEGRFGFGMAVGVGGEIVPETVERMLEICDVVFADVQSLIRKFEKDGTVRLVRLAESGFSHLLPRLGFLKASAEEAPFVDVEETKKQCCVVVTNGKDGCTLYWKDFGECKIPAFPAVEVDPTGAGDCFLGGLAAGLMHGGLSVPDAALLGNLYGSLTVAHIGIPKFDPKLVQQIKDELERRKTRKCSCANGEIMKQPSLLVGCDYNEEFHAYLVAAVLQQQQFLDNDEEINSHYCNPQHNLFVSPVFGEPPIQTVNTNP